MLSTPYTHKNLCTLAARWLRYPHSRGGHGCQVAVTEVASGFKGERPDAIGFRTGNPADEGSVIVEAKVSRADFQADARKPHRRGTGLGTWRYYLCPEGVIAPEDLPPRWGLIHVRGQTQLKVVVGAFATRDYREQRKALEAMRHESDFARERFILTRLLTRVGDTEEASQKERALRAERDTLQTKLIAAQQAIADHRRQALLSANNNQRAAQGK